MELLDETLARGLTGLAKTTLADVHSQPNFKGTSIFQDDMSGMCQL